MAVKEKLLQGGGVGPVVGRENHLPVGSNTCLVTFPVSHLAVCHLQYEKEATTCSDFA